MILGIGSDLANIDRIEATPVSYTHLDVYKRQRKDKASWSLSVENHWDGSRGCVRWSIRVVDSGGRHAMASTG